ncbi:12843_t:CDS:1, partial [Funneliformis caledonium]
AVKSAVKRAAASGIDDDGKLEARAVLKEAIGELWWDCNQISPILIEGRPTSLRDPSV